MFNFVLVLIAFSVANSNTAVSGVVISFMLPSLLLGILAGVYVDKRNKKNILLGTNILRALLIFPLIFLHTNILFIYVFTFLVAVVTQFYVPAETPIIPHLVKRDLLLSANALFGIGLYASIFIAYALSGPMLLLFGKTNIFIFLGVVFLVSALFAYLIDFKEEHHKENTAEVLANMNMAKEIRTAISIMAKTKTIYSALLLLTLAQIIILVLATIGPGYAEHVLKIRIENFPVVFVIPAIIGMALGAIILGSFFHKFSKEKLTRIGLIIVGVSILLLPYGSSFENRAIVHAVNSYLPHILRITGFHILILLAFILGFGNALVFIPANTILQEETSDEFRGKVYGALSTLVGLFSFLPIILAGSLADLIGVKGVLTIIGIAVLLVVLLRIILSRGEKQI